MYQSAAKEEIDSLVARMGIGWLVRRWEKTTNRVCPSTGRTVEFEDVLAGHYSLPRIGGNSENGYEVCPDWEYLVSLFKEGHWDGKYQ